MPCHAMPYLSKNLPWSTFPAPSEVGGGLYETDASNVDISLHDLCFRTLGRIKRDHTSCARADRTALFLSQEKSGHTTSLGMHTIHEFILRRVCSWKPANFRAGIPSATSGTL